MNPHPLSAPKALAVRKLFLEFSQFYLLVKVVRTQRQLELLWLSELKPKITGTILILVTLKHYQIPIKDVNKKMRLFEKDAKAY
jgi:hypothetical protein